jgi:uncharacterized tellurite resistance protein B-like protein
MTARPNATESTFAFEMTKLLLQAVWADGEVADEEAEAVHDFAVRAGVELADIETLDACLGGQSPLPVPNLGLLRERRADVMRALQKLVASDARVHEDEESLLRQISELLG